MPEPYAANALPVGTMVQEYRILKVLGAGSFGIVYQAENLYLDEVVAIKEFLPSDLACRTESTRVVPLSSTTEEPYLWALRQFLKEAQILWNLARPERHPNIVRVSRFHEDNGTAYMVMDFEEGRSLAATLDERGRLPEAELRAILFPLLDGLERVHNASVWHRDIKPANILIRPDGSPVFIDFGAARQDRGDQARSIMAMYSPAYAAPEQVMAMGEQGPWTDIYSLAATLYRAVTGRTPTSVAERALGAAHVPAVEAGRGEYSPGLLLAIDAALSLQPRERPQSVAEWRRQLLAPEPVAGAADLEATVVASSLPRPPDAATGLIIPGVVTGHAPRHESLLLAEPPPLAPPPPGNGARSGKRRTTILVAAVAGVAVAAGIGYALLGPGLWPTTPDRGTTTTRADRAAPPADRFATVPPTREIPAEPASEPAPATPAGWAATSPQEEPPAYAASTPPTPTAPSPATAQLATTPPAIEPLPQPPASEAATSAAVPPPAVAHLTPPRAAAVDHTAVAAAVSDVVAGFDCAELSATLSSDMRVFVTGRVASAQDESALQSRLAAVEHVKGVVPRVEVLGSPFCDIAGLLGPLGLSGAQAGRTGPAINVNSPTRTFREGQFLVVEVTAGAGHQGHLYVGYLDSSGTWVHMLPSPLHPSNTVAPGQRVVLGAEPAADGTAAQQYEIAPPHGRGMIVALVSRTPLFSKPRPEIENLTEFLPALDAELARLQAQGRLDEVSASALYIETRP